MDATPAIVEREIWTRACGAFDAVGMMRPPWAFESWVPRPGPAIIRPFAICSWRIPRAPYTADTAGWTLVRSGLALQIVALERAIRCDEFLTVALYLRGYLLQEQGLGERAAESYREAAKVGDG